MKIEAEGIREIVAPEAQRLMEGRPEGSYLLLDVRQPQEYEAGHLPGARLLPLPELEERAAQLERGRPVITYCRSGNRSRAAAALLQGLGFGEVYSLAGGMLGWGGAQARGWPRVHLFTGAEDVVTALNLVFFMERGAQKFYLEGARRAQAADVAGLLRELAAAEEGHLRAAYARLAAVRNELPGFEEYRELADSDLMEGALEPADYLPILDAVAAKDLPHVLEMAVELEAVSLDLYRSLAAQAPDPEVRATLLAMSDQERLHLRLLSEKLGELAGREAG